MITIRKKDVLDLLERVPKELKLCAQTYSPTSNQCVYSFTSIRINRIVYGSREAYMWLDGLLTGIIETDKTNQIEDIHHDT